MNPNDLFGGIYYINLDRRPDLNDFALAQHHRAGIAATRIPGFDMTAQPGDIDYLRARGHLGCTIAHFTALTLAAYRNLPSVLILEDDALFVDDFQARFDESLEHLPADWDIWFLGAWTGGQFAAENWTAVSGPIRRLHFGLWTHAYAVHERVYDHLLGAIATTRKAVDNTIAALMPGLNVYATAPGLATQAHHFSETDYSNQVRVME